MLNNKGQSLVLFILLIPILVGVMVLVIDVGELFHTKVQIENVTEMVLEYGLDHIQDDDFQIEILKDLMQENLTMAVSEVEIEQEKIHIITKTKVASVFSRMFGFREFQIVSEYQGYLDGDQKQIEKIK